MTPPTPQSEKLESSTPETVLITRLRNFQWANYRLRIDDSKYLCREAADTIESLERRLSLTSEAEIYQASQVVELRRRLREALEELATEKRYSESLVNIGESWKQRAEAAERHVEREGRVMVPIIPTNAMVEAGRAAMTDQNPATASHARVLWIWKDMLDAAALDLSRKEKL